MKVLRTKEDVLSIKNGDEVLVYDTHNNINRLTVCEVKIPYSPGTRVALIRKQGMGGLGASSLEELYRYLIKTNVWQHLQVYRG